MHWLCGRHRRPRQGAAPGPCPSRDRRGRRSTVIRGEHRIGRAARRPRPHARSTRTLQRLSGWPATMISSESQIGTSTTSAASIDETSSLYATSSSAHAPPSLGQPPELTVPTRQAVTLPLVAPIVPVLRDQPFDDPAFLFEPQYDGFCELLYLSGRGCHFRSKRGNILSSSRSCASGSGKNCGSRRRYSMGGRGVGSGGAAGLSRPPRAPGEPPLRRVRRPLAQREGPARAAAHPAEARASAGHPATTPLCSRACSRSRHAGGTSSRLHSGSTSRGSWPSGRPIPIRPRPSGTRLKNGAYTQMEGRWELFEKRR
jgi:hypothetical protein